MTDFAAIDFEIANGYRSSICSVGIVIVRGGKVVDKIYRLIRPEPDYYWQYFSNIHGLTHADTCNAKVFPEVWAEIAPKIECLPLAAHNSAFDRGCLIAAHRFYRMVYPDYEFFCTCRASRRIFGNTLPNHQLHTVAAHCGYNLANHHHALSDAEACAEIAMKIL
ncbi:MAG: DNA polymerase III subunit epsilon [Bacteroidales bacterium]